LVAGGFQGELTCKVSQMLSAIHVDMSSCLLVTLATKWLCMWFQSGK